MISDATRCYLEYLNKYCPNLDAELWATVSSILENTSWDNPTSAIDWNNVGVVALIEAEQSSNLAYREMYLEIGLEALKTGLEVHKNPLCAAHLAILMVMIGEVDQAREIAFSTFVDTLMPAYCQSQKLKRAIVYFPPPRSSWESCYNEQIIQVLEVDDGHTQSILLLSEALYHIQRIFYNSTGLRFLHLAAQIFPGSVDLNFKLGLASIFNGQWEGLLYLHRAHQLAPDNVYILQSLYLTYIDLGQTDVANFWLGVVRELSPPDPDTINFQWTKLEVNNSLTYLPV